MGSLIGGLITKKKRKKLSRQLRAEYELTAQSQIEAQRLEQLRANFGARQEKIQQLREGRIRRAQVLSSAVGAGVQVGTAVQGGASAAYSAALSGVSQLNVFQAYSEAVSKQNEIIAASQGRQAVLGAKIQTQQEKAALIGSAVDTGIGIATLPWGGVQGAGRAAGTLF